jgi:hypothetical protein
MKHLHTFESFLNEGNNSLGSKAKRFTDNVGEWDWFTDAEGADEPLPQSWHNALKNLRANADDAIVCFYDAVGSMEDVLDFANKAGLKYIEVKDGEGGSDGIVFSAKQ